MIQNPGVYLPRRLPSCSPRARPSLGATADSSISPWPQCPGAARGPLMVNLQSETRREVNHGLHTERLNESSTEASSVSCVMRLLTTILRIRRLGRNQHPRSEPVAATATTIFLSKPTQITKLAENHILFDLERQFHDGMDCFQTASCSVSATSWFPVRSRHTLTGEKT